MLYARIHMMMNTVRFMNAMEIKEVQKGWRGVYKGKGEMKGLKYESMPGIHCSGIKGEDVEDIFADLGKFTLDFPLVSVDHHDCTSLPSIPAQLMRQFSTTCITDNVLVCN
jgi:hypothetical protein